MILAIGSFLLSTPNRSSLLGRLIPVLLTSSVLPRSSYLEVGYTSRLCMIGGLRRLLPAPYLLSEGARLDGRPSVLYSLPFLVSLGLRSLQSSTASAYVVVRVRRSTARIGGHLLLAIVLSTPESLSRPVLELYRSCS
jgi:hypothetical protein